MEAAPPRFANTLGFVFLSVATVAYFGFSPPLASGWVAWGVALLVSVLALLSATTGPCVGCELYVAVRRVATPGAGGLEAGRPRLPPGRGGSLTCCSSRSRWRLWSWRWC